MTVFFAVTAASMTDWVAYLADVAVSSTVAPAGPDGMGVYDRVLRQY
jgi:hypothetical protein